MSGGDPSSDLGRQGLACLLRVARVVAVYSSRSPKGCVYFFPVQICAASGFYLVETDNGGPVTESRSYTTSDKSGE
jgi:hypothetical protein